MNKYSLLTVGEAILWPGGRWFESRTSKDWKGKDWTYGDEQEADSGAALSTCADCIGQLAVPMLS